MDHSTSKPTITQETETFPARRELKKKRKTSEIPAESKDFLEKGFCPYIGEKTT